jgi:hypothetical protein
MNWVADYIVDDDRDAAHSQSLVNKLDYFLRLQMVNKEARTYYIETFVCEGKRERIAGHCEVPVFGQVRMRPIE